MVRTSDLRSRGREFVEAHGCEQLAQSCYAAAPWTGGHGARIATVGKLFTPMCLDSDSLRYCMEPWNRAGRCFNLCSKQPQQSGIPAQEVQEATGAVRGRLWTHPVPRQSHDQTLPGAARSTARLRLQAGQIRPAAQHLTAGFSDAAFVKPLPILLPDLLSSLWFELICWLEFQ